jgi:pimeloyl-ACP methyl ester carboxylesterase
MRKSDIRAEPLRTTDYAILTMPETEVHTVNGLETHVLRGGSGPPLVYLHGVAPAGEWLPLHDLLAERFTVYVPDHPGFGRTDRPEWLDGMDDLVLHYEELLRHLGLERPALVGFSLGGWIAAEYAVTYPERVGALVLFNAAGLHRDEALIPDLPALTGERLSTTVFHDQRKAREYFASRRGPDERARQYRGLATAALLAWNPWFDPKLERRLRRITAPTLALWAEHDRLIAPLYAEVYAHAIPNAQVQILPGCGHMALIECPFAVARAIIAFIEGTNSHPEPEGRGAPGGEGSQPHRSA